MTYRARNIVLAVALAVVAALLTGFYVTNYKRTVQHGEHRVSVYVATKDIPAGTSGADVASGGYLKKVEVPRRAVVPGAISKPNEVAKQIVSDQVNAGEQVSTRRFTTNENAGVRAKLQGTQRAIEVNGTPRQLLAGTLKAGDKVDLVAYFDDFSRIVLRDIYVLAPPDGVGATTKLDASQQSSHVMLRLTDTQIQKFWFTVNDADGKAQGWSLALRPVVNPVDSGEVVETLKTVFADGLNRFQFRRIFKDVFKNGSNNE